VDQGYGRGFAGPNADIVIDMISFELEGAQQLVEALRGRVEHYLFCSSIWVHGHATSVPSVETDRTNAIDTYRINGVREGPHWASNARRFLLDKCGSRPNPTEWRLTSQVDCSTHGRQGGSMRT
jgi:hypothetical protein